MTEIKPPPITREVARDLGRARFGEVPVTPDASVDKARQLFNESKAEQALLELASPSLVPHDEKDVKNSLVKRYSSERNGDGKKVEPSDAQERRRLREAKGKAEQYRDFLENGKISPDMRKEVKGFLERASAGFQDAIVGKTPTEIDAMVDSYVINDPVFRSKLIRIYGERADPKKSMNGEKEVHDLELSLAKLEAKLKGEVSDVELQNAQTAVATAEANLTASGANVTEIAGYQTDFENLAPRMNAVRSALASKGKIDFEIIDAQVVNLQSQIDSGTLSAADYKTTFSMINTLKTKSEYAEYKAAQSTVDRYESAKAYMDALNPTQKTAINEVTSTQAKLKELKDKASGSMSASERADVDAQIMSLKIELADAKDALQAEMVGDYRDVTHMAQDVTQEMLNEEMKQLPELYKKAAVEESAKQQEEVVKQQELGDELNKYKELELNSASEKLLRLWKTERTRRGMVTLVTNRALAGDVVNGWVQHGNEGIRDYIDTIPDADLTHSGFTPGEISVLRGTMVDPDRSRVFLDKNADVIATHALADYFVAGGRFGKAEVQAMAGSEKGRSLLKLAMKDVEEQRTSKNELAGKGVLRGVDNIIGGRPSGEKRRFGAARIGLAALLLIFGAAAFKGSKG